MGIHERLLSALGSSWDNLAPLPTRWIDSQAAATALDRLTDLCTREFTNSLMWGVKDPRICRFVPLWQRLLERLDIESRYILILRHPDEVAESLHRRDLIDISAGRWLWMSHYLEAEFHTRGERRAVVLLDELIYDWRATLASVSSHLDIHWPIPVPVAADSIDAFLEPSLQHHRVRTEEDVPTASTLLYTQVADCVRNADIGLRGNRALYSRLDFARQISELPPSGSFAEKCTCRVLFQGTIGDPENVLCSTKIVEGTASDISADLPPTCQAGTFIHVAPADRPGLITIDRLVFSHGSDANNNERKTAVDLSKVIVAGTAYPISCSSELRILATGAHPQILIPTSAVEQDLAVGRVTFRLRVDTRIAPLVALAGEAAGGGRHAVPLLSRLEERADESHAPELVQLFIPTGKEYSESDSMRRSVPKGEWTRVTFVLTHLPPPSSIGFRLDPRHSPGLVRIRRVAIVSTSAPGHQLLNSSSDTRFDQLAVGDTTLRLPSGDGLLLAATDSDPQLFLPPIAITESSLPVEVSIEMRVESPMISRPDIMAVFRELSLASQRDITNHDQMVAKYKQDIAFLNGQDKQMTRKLAATQAEAQKSVVALNNILRSRSWRFMKPYRFIGSYFRLLLDSYWAWRSGLFDAAYYLTHNPDVVEAGVSPLLHFVRHGAREGRNPSRFFDTSWYLQQNPDVAAAGTNPLIHYIRHGATEGRPPHPVAWSRGVLTTKRARFAAAVEPLNQPSVPFHKCGGDAPDFSVVIPTFNRANLLPTLLDAWRVVQRSTRLSFEMIFSDDGSADDTCRVLQCATDLPLRLIRNQHRGVCHARNQAILQSRGHRILITGDDIFPCPSILDEHARRLDAGGQRDAVLGRIDWHPDIPRTYLMKHISEVGNEQFSFNRLIPLQNVDFRHFYTSNVSIHSDFLLSEWPLFEEQFREVNFEDVELAYRLAKRGMRILYCPNALAFHHHIYADWRAFMRRQEAAGRMSVTMTRLHPEMSLILPPLARHTDLASRLSSATPLFKRIDLLFSLHPACTLAQLPVLEDQLSTALSEVFHLALTVGQYAELNNIPNNPDKTPLTEKLAAAPRLIRDLEPHSAFPATPPRIAVLVGTTGTPSEREKIGFHDTFGTRHLIVEDAMSGYLPRPLTGVSGLTPYPDLARIPADYICLTPARGLPEFDAVMQGLLCVSVLDYDYLIIQQRTDSPDRVDPMREGTCVFCRPALSSHFLKRGNGEPSGRGRFVRIMTATTTVSDSTAVTSSSIVSVAPNGDICAPQNSPPARRRCCASALPQHIKIKPVILVIPVAMAVGGVERNTLAIMRALRDTHDFVIVTLERSIPSTGSLHHELNGLTVAAFDLAELAPDQDVFLSHLACIRDSFAPDAVWLCNGSPWLFDHAEDIREIFRTIPIIDQTVYDTEAGWITRHDEAGPLSFDHFIAINTPIRNKLIHDYGVPDDRVSLIHSAIDETRLTSMRQFDTGKKEMRKKLGLPTDGLLFCFVGRLSDQKQPLRFVDLAHRSRALSNITFVIVGDGPLRKHVEDASRSLPNIRLLGFRNDLISIYMAADGLVITSSFEGLPIAMLEAMACGIPVFATDVGDIRTTVERYGVGLVVPKNTSDRDLYLEFGKWLNNLTDYTEKAKNSSEQVRSDFSPTQAAPLYERAWSRGASVRKASSHSTLKGEH